MIEVNFPLVFGVIFSKVFGLASIASAPHPLLIASIEADASYAPHSIKNWISNFLNKLKYKISRYSAVSGPKSFSDV